MKNTKIIIAIITTYLLMWLLLTGICYAITDLTFKESALNKTVIIFQIFFGWIPSVIVVSDII